jgi:hypothetical protein
MCAEPIAASAALRYVNVNNHRRSAIFYGAFTVPVSTHARRNDGRG